MTTRCLIALGSNLGCSRDILDQAVKTLSRHFHEVTPSRWYAYPSVGPSADEEPQPDFLNGVVAMESAFSVEQTALRLHQIEQDAGRTRTVRWSSRTLDIDLLLYGDKIFQTDTLTVPHPRMACRKFVLEPASEVAPDITHPIFGWSMKRLYEHLLQGPPVFALASETNQQPRAETFVRRLAKITGGSGLLLSPAGTCELVGSLADEETIQCPPSDEVALAAFADSIHSDTGQPWFLNFWEPLAAVEAISSLTDEQKQHFAPKLIMVLEDEATEYSRILSTMELAPEQRVPIVRLSHGEQEAWQDALGAVQGMDT